MDPMTGMPMEMPMEPEIIPEEGPLDYVEDFPRTEIIRSYHSGHEVIKEEILGLRDFPYQFITAFEDYSDQSKRQFFGLMRPMRDPQRYANKFFSQAVHMFADRQSEVRDHPTRPRHGWSGDAAEPRHAVGVGRRRYLRAVHSR
jgi:hypothetical protein